MADRMKGITVEIGGDTTKLSQALSGLVFCKTAEGCLPEIYMESAWQKNVCLEMQTADER